jgi:hypothetical protein
MMILGMSPFLLFHVTVSVIGLAAGFVVIAGLLKGERLPGWTAVFLITTVLTNATGFGLPADHFMPSHAVAIISLVVLLIAIVALYGFHLAARWRATYVITASLALWFNVFVLVAQIFNKVPSLAPLQTQPPFLVTQVVVLALFIMMCIIALRKFHPAR